MICQSHKTVSHGSVNNQKPDSRRSAEATRTLEIYAQYIDCDGIGGTVWVNEEMISPGPGNYAQTRPIVQTSSHETASVFWYDSKTGDQCIMGTRMHNLSGGINWNKRVQAPALLAERYVTLSNSYPNPVSLSQHSTMRIPVQLERDGPVELRIFNVLGQPVASVYKGWVPAGERLFLFDFRKQHLQSGMYFLYLVTNGNSQRRAFVVTH